MNEWGCETSHITGTLLFCLCFLVSQPNYSTKRSTLLDKISILVKISFSDPENTQKVKSGLRSLADAIAAQRFRTNLEFGQNFDLIRARERGRDLPISLKSLTYCDTFEQQW